jgi:hypothetical protein
MKSDPSSPLLQQVVQIGILITALGAVLALIGLYPSITGLEPKSGIGVVQIVIILAGLTLIILGGLVFVKVGFYADSESTLIQRIAVRLSLTGLLLAGAVGLSDLLGYGSNPSLGEESSPVVGRFQALGMIFGFIVASAGVLIFMVGGEAPPEAN